MIIRNKEFDDSKTYVMGILNVTPDSFSDGGKWNQLDAALAHAEEMLKAGAAIIDVGGESTRPGYEQITDQEEIERVVPVIEAIRRQIDVPISIDTYKATVARAAVEAGADLINDIWGLKYDLRTEQSSTDTDINRMEKANVCDSVNQMNGIRQNESISPMAQVIADTGVACCLMHNREKKSIQIEENKQSADILSMGASMDSPDEYGYDNFVEDMLSDLRESVALAESASISRDRIILDPGVGFAKTYEQNLLAIRHVGRLKELGLPVLLGTSRKSVIGLTLDTDKNNRLEGTLATTIYAVEHGCMFVRVHDVKENVRAVHMIEAVLGVND